MVLFGIRDYLKLSSASMIFLALSFSCPAQTSRVAGDIQGSIADQSRTAIAGARVTLRNQGTHQMRRMLTDARGFFRAAELQAGRYELHVESPGFSTYADSAIVDSRR